MKYLRDSDYISKIPTWEESSGFLEFLSTIPKEVEKFNNTFGFDIQYRVIPPSDIDGNREIIRKVGFIVIRENRLIPERMYCLYSLLERGVLHGYIGLYEDSTISTIRELSPIRDYREALVSVYDWLRALIKASCEKY